MKVLVATQDGQGKRKNDFMNATEGELVTFANECDGENVDGKCGCRRAFSGMDSLKATTTVKIVDRPDLTSADYVQALRASLEKAGWAKLFSDKELTEMVAKDIGLLVSLANAAPVGSVIEKRGGSFNVRRNLQEVRS